MYFPNVLLPLLATTGAARCPQLRRFFLEFFEKVYCFYQWLKTFHGFCRLRESAVYFPNVLLPLLATTGSARWPQMRTFFLEFFAFMYCFWYTLKQFHGFCRLSESTVYFPNVLLPLLATTGSGEHFSIYIILHLQLFSFHSPPRALRYQCQICLSQTYHGDDRCQI